MRVSITIAKDEVSPELLALEDAPRRLLKPAGRGLRQGALEVIGIAQDERFSGKGPFPVSQHKVGVRTGLLRRSLRASRPKVNARTGEVSISIGSNVEYFGIHEFGFSGKVQVRAHSRRLPDSGKLHRGKLSKKSQRRLKKRLLKREFGGGPRKTYASTAQVRAHSRRLRVPARRPLGTALDDVRSRLAFRRAVRREIDAELKGGLS